MNNPNRTFKPGAQKGQESTQQKAHNNEHLSSTSPKWKVKKDKKGNGKHLSFIGRQGYET